MLFKRMAQRIIVKRVDVSLWGKGFFCGRSASPDHVITRFGHYENCLQSLHVSPPGWFGTFGLPARWRTITTSEGEGR